MERAPLDTLPGFRRRFRITPLSGAVPSVAAPSLNVTVPVGVEPLAEAVAVSVTVPPVVDVALDWPSASVVAEIPPSPATGAGSWLPAIQIQSRPRCRPASVVRSSGATRPGPPSS